VRGERPERFKAGDGVALCYRNDVYPGTVRRVSPSGHRVWVSEDDIARAYFDPCLGPVAQAYSPRDVEPQHWRVFTRRRDGYYAEKGHQTPYLVLGRDYSKPREI